MPIVVFVTFQIKSTLCVTFSHHERKSEQGKGKKDVKMPIFKRGRGRFQMGDNPEQGKPAKEICSVHF
jgi:hypothetical protein